MNDNFENIINENIKIERNNIPFKITQLKLTHYYWNSGDIDVGMPISTSIELTSKYNFETDTLEWNKIITHIYISLEDCYKTITDSYRVRLFNSNEIISRLEKNDLRNFNNNYFTDENPDRFTHWEITYNTYFKIVGTYDQELEVFKKFSELLNFKEIMETEIKKVDEKLNQQ